MKRKIIFIAAVMLIAAALSGFVSASDLDVTVCSENFNDDAQLVNGTTCLWFRSFMSEITNGEIDVYWDEKSRTAYAESDGISVSAHVGDSYIIANGRYIMCGAPNYIENGRMMVAVRPMAKAFGAEVLWNERSRSVTVGEMGNIIEDGEDYYDADELYWLSRIISAESRGEPLIGKLAVAAVVYNRVESEDYPDTVYDVIFDMEHGVQFTPAATGTVYNEPTQESVIAAKLAMEGYRYRDDILYFCTNEIAKTCWAGCNRTYVETIGGHTFFS